MPAAAVAVSGRARVVSSWPKLVERLVSEPTTKRLRHGTHRSVPGAGGSIRDWVERCGGRPRPRQPCPAETPMASCTFSHQRTLATPPCS
jgi:hypothetical protein